MKLKYFILTIFAVFQFIVSAQSDSKTFLFVGSYTNGEKNYGIHVYEFNENNGSLIEVYKEGNLINASFLTLSNNGAYLYACTDTRLKKSGSVSSFKIDTVGGKLTFLNKQKTNARNPVHAIVDGNDEFVIVSSYTDSSVGLFKFSPDGSLAPILDLKKFTGSSIILERQSESHIHSAVFSPDNSYIFASDLGTDRINALRINSENQLQSIDSLSVETDKGSGPRHFTFHPNLRFAYSVEELSGTVAAYSYHQGKLSKFDSYFSYRNTQEIYGSADIHISPDGLFLYVSNRGGNENTLSIFKIDQTEGTLELIGHQNTFGDQPRSFVIDPSGQFLLVANQNSGIIVVFKRNAETGLLTKTKSDISVSLPASLKMRTYKNQ